MARSDPRLGAVLLERYRIDRAIGCGAMGTVYEGVHLGLGRAVAIKVLHPQHVGSASEERFIREGRAAANISSEHIVQTFDVGSDPTHGLFLVTELLEGEDLDQRLRRDRRLDVDVVVTIGQQVGRGLSRAHAAGIVHRDLKPANVFLTTRDDESLLAKIVDFGISKRIDTDEDGPLTSRGTAVGTPQYMSPEQLSGSMTVDGRADVWSLGAVLYEALTGSPPFANRPSHVEIMLAIAREDVPSLRRVAPWVPRPVADVIDGALVRDRDLRVPSAADFATQLGVALAKHGRREDARRSGTLRRATARDAVTLQELDVESQLVSLDEPDIATERDPRLARTRRRTPV